MKPSIGQCPSRVTRLKGLGPAGRNSTDASPRLRIGLQTAVTGITASVSAPEVQPTREASRKRPRAKATF